MPLTLLSQSFINWNLFTAFVMDIFLDLNLCNSYTYIKICNTKSHRALLIQN